MAGWVAGWGASVARRMRATQFCDVSERSMTSEQRMRAAREDSVRCACRAAFARYVR